MNLLSIDNEMLFALLSGKLSSAINRKLYRSFRKINIDITPEQWTVLYYLWSKDRRDVDFCVCRTFFRITFEYFYF